VRRYVSASLGNESKSARAAVPLTHVPRSRARSRLVALLSWEENETSCVKDLGYGNDTVPKEFAGERPVCQRAPNTEWGTRCATKPNTKRTQGIPSQPTVSKKGRQRSQEARQQDQTSDVLSSRSDDVAWC
jgi:hypothetical protein